MVTPANTVSRTARVGAAVVTPRSAARHQHIYEYDSVGPPRYTLIFILATVAQDEDLWPAWASQFYHSLTHTCKDIAHGVQQSNRESIPGDAQQPLRPCFRELRPSVHRMHT
jgi:hypothetical protein